jgi:hypothetical protein
MLARVVSKWVLPGITSPGLTTAAHNKRSEARPWWVGITCLWPNTLFTEASKRKKERAPA